MIAENVDYICPLWLSAHYAKYEYGIPHPNAAPYQTVRYSLGDHLEEVEGTKQSSPWLQDSRFTVSHYGRDGSNSTEKSSSRDGRD